MVNMPLPNEYRILVYPDRTVIRQRYTWQKRFDTACTLTTEDEAIEWLVSRGIRTFKTSYRRESI